MIKLIVLLISLFAALIECYFIPFEFSIKVLLFILFTILNVIVIVALFFILLFIVEIPVNKKKETQHYSRFYRYILYLGTKTCLSLFGVKINVEGLDKIPQDDNFVIVFNHLSNLDTMVMDVVLHDYPLVFVAKKSLFKIPFVGKLIHKTGYIKLDRGNLRQEVQAITKGVNFLKTNECSIGVSPEGTRNFTEETLLPFKTGCFYLVTESHKPVVITTISGTNKVKQNLFFKKHEVTFKILDVLNYDEYKDLSRLELSSKVKVIMLNELTKQDLNSYDGVSDQEEGSIPKGALQ